MIRIKDTYPQMGNEGRRELCLRDEKVWALSPRSYQSQWWDGFV